jgi:transposase
MRPVVEERMEDLLAMIHSSDEGVSRAEMMERWGVTNTKTASRPFDALKEAGLIACTTPRGGRPRWTTPENVDALRDRMRDLSTLAERQAKIIRNRKREELARELTGYRRANFKDVPDIPVVQRRVDKWSPPQGRLIASVWDLAQ